MLVLILVLVVLNGVAIDAARCGGVDVFAVGTVGVRVASDIDSKKFSDSRCAHKSNYNLQ